MDVAFYADAKNKILTCTLLEMYLDRENIFTIFCTGLY